MYILGQQWIHKDMDYIPKNHFSTALMLCISVWCILNTLKSTQEDFEMNIDTPFLLATWPLYCIFVIHLFWSLEVEDQVQV